MCILSNKLHLILSYRIRPWYSLYIINLEYGYILNFGLYLGKVNANI